jgi:hypothetical protein
MVFDDSGCSTRAQIVRALKGFAKRLGLTPLPGFAQTMAGLTGIENPMQVAILPTLQMGRAKSRKIATGLVQKSCITNRRWYEFGPACHFANLPVSIFRGRVDECHPVLSLSVPALTAGPQVEPDADRRS